MIDGLESIIENEIEKRCADKINEIEKLKGQINVLTAGFTINQQVWRSNFVQDGRETCDICNKGKITKKFLDIDITISCPKCDSRSEIDKYTYKPQSEIVKRVGYKNSYDDYLTVWFKDGRDARVDSVYESIEKCQNECDKYNNTKNDIDYSERIDEAIIKKYLADNGVKGVNGLFSDSEIFRNICKAISISNDELRENVKKYTGEN